MGGGTKPAKDSRTAGKGDQLAGPGKNAPKDVRTMAACEGESTSLRVAGSPATLITSSTLSRGEREDDDTLKASSATQEDL